MASHSTSVDRWVRALQRPHLLVVGGASLDQIVVEGIARPTPGGAGLYTALAAARAGVRVTMLAPRPDPMPPQLAPALSFIDWVGPTVTPDELPRFEISYTPDGDVDRFREFLGAEAGFEPDLLDHLDVTPSCAYCVPFLDARRQRRFIDALHDRGYLVVGATYGLAAEQETDLVRDTFTTIDLAFCNAYEHSLLFPDDPAPSTGQLRFVTRGADGATVFQGDHRTDIPAEPTKVFDPTGAGDTFCGTTVARILLGEHPVEAARAGHVAAAATVSDLGPAALMAPVRSMPTSQHDRVSPDAQVINAISTMIATHDELAPFEFTGELFPAAGDPSAVAWFGASTLQQFGFWYDDGVTWTGSMIAPIEGTDRKGSDYVWAMYHRWNQRDRDAMCAAHQAEVTPTLWSEVAADDFGHDPFPHSKVYADQAAAYGRTLTEWGVEMGDLVDRANASDRPMQTLLGLLDHVGGYREDPLRKKAALLGVILRQRPEQLLRPADDDDAPPIVDYHVQRSCLRTGLIHVNDPDLAQSLTERQVVSAADEERVRRAAFDAVNQVCQLSGRSMGTVDWFLFQMRYRCPEASKPQCASCPADSACEHRTELFQPVFRTTAY